MKRLGLVAAAAAVGASAIAPGAYGQDDIDYAGHFGWSAIGQAECVGRGTTVINLAGERFDLPFDTEVFDGWYVASNLGHTSVRIFCPSDMDDERLVAPDAERILVIIDVDTVRTDLSGPLRDFIRDCFFEDACEAGISPPAGPGNGLEPPEIGWDDHPRDFGVSREELGEELYSCPERGDEPYQTIYGAGIYTDDSSICSAAVHVGAITDAGGVVMIRTIGPQDSFRGGERNGVNSLTFGRWPGSYVFLTFSIGPDGPVPGEPILVPGTSVDGGP